MTEETKADKWNRHAVKKTKGENKPDVVKMPEIKSTTEVIKEELEKAGYSKDEIKQMIKDAVTQSQQSFVDALLSTVQGESEREKQELKEKATVQPEKKKTGLFGD